MKNKLSILTALMATLSAIAACEIYLRLTHHQIVPYWKSPENVMREPTTNEPDPILGWKPLPGRYVFPPYTSESESFTMTIWPNGARATAPTQRHQVRSVVAVGCSLTQGWAIRDEDTMLWELQEQHPNVEFVNLGVGGYSTYQSLLALEDYLDTAARPPDVVLYGLHSHHAMRNVGDLGWEFVLSLMAKRGQVAVPHCLLGDGDELQCFPPESYPIWPGDRTLRIVNLLKSAFIKWENRRRVRDARPVMEELLARMAAECQSRGIRFYVVLLLLQGAAERQYYADFLRKAKIAFIDCDDPRSRSPAMIVQGEGHPNGAMNAIWAQCIEAGIRRELQ